MEKVRPGIFRLPIVKRNSETLDEHRARARAPSTWWTCLTPGGSITVSAVEKVRPRYLVAVPSVQMANLGWARPNRVVSQAMFQKFAAGHPKF